MELSGSYLLDAPSYMVWNALQDPVVLSAILPGSQEFRKTGENTYTGQLLVRVGPVQGVFEGQIKLSDFKAPNSYWMNVDGKSAIGILNASGRINLEAQGDNTYLTYQGQANVTGRVASVGQRLVESSARVLIRQSLEALNDYLKAKLEHPDQPVELSPNRMTVETARITQTSARVESPIPAAQALTPDKNRGRIPARYIVLGVAALVIIAAVVMLVARR